MEKTTTNNVFKKLYCGIFGHNYEVTKRVTYHVKEYTCTCCNKQVTTNSNGYLTELTPKFKEINAILERIYTNKLVRMQNKTIAA